MSTFLLLLQAFFALALGWSCFCRMVRTDEHTVREIRLAIWFEGVASGLVLLAPWMPILWPDSFSWRALTTPTWVWLCLLLAAALVQIATARHWRHGVPADFQRTTI
ncbi:MAG: hypothetical protein Q7U28_08015 [Aquabacterium sp.]|nr:hypothetical protein [Aquabacterium sp.]